jgi:pimeloyl-ACP methyl ester carboxylesterase
MTIIRFPKRILLAAAVALAASGAGDGRSAAADLAVPGGALHYEVRGSGFPLVFIHDGIAHSAVWDAQFAAFEPDYRVIRYDRRGYGESPAPDSAYSNVEDLEALLAALGVRRAVLIGSSAGGGLAIDYALEHPERVEALVLSGPAVNGLGYTLHFMKRAYANFGADIETTVARWAADTYAVAPGNDAARARLRSLLDACPQNLGFIQHRLAQEPDVPALDRLGEIRVPTLLVTGDHDIPDVHAHMGAIEAGIAGARRVVLEGAGHLGYLEQPEAFNAEVREFLSLISLAPGSPLLADAPAPPWDTYERGFAPVDGTVLYYETMGAGEPLVLLHGGAIDHRMWDDQFAGFARRFRVVRYDARGFGLSQSPFGTYRHYEDFRALLRHLGIARAHLAGLSMGCRLAVDLAIAHPEMVSSLVLASPGISGYAFDTAESKAYMERIGAAFGRGDFAQAAEEFVRAWTDGPKRTPAGTPPAVREKIKAMALATVRPDRDLGNGLELEPPAVGRLAEVRAPALVILGSLDMPDIHDIAKRISKQAPGARVKTMKGAAHMVNMEDPAAFDGIVLEFIGGLGR